MSTPAKPARAGPQDDRGQSITPLSLADVRRAERDPNQRRALLARRLRDAIRVESQRFSWVRLGVILGLVIAGNILHVVLVSVAPSMRAVPTFWILFVGAIIAFRFWGRRSAANDLARTAVAEGLCGACAYSLQDLPTEPDGCLHCPECGAAWLGTRITRPHWKDDASAAPAYDPPWWKRTIFNIPRPRDLLAPDDRGRFVPVMDSHLKLLPPARRAAWGRARVRTLRRRLRAVGALPRTAVAALLPLPMFVLAWAIGTFGRFNLGGAPNALSAEILIPMAIVIAVGLIIFLSVYWSSRFGPPRRLIPLYREARLCASCGDDLAGIGPAPDGCTDCPTCGAGWRTAPPTPPPAGTHAMASSAPAPTADTNAYQPNPESRTPPASA